MSDKPSYEELESYIEKLEEKVFKKLRAEKINQVLIYISNAVNTVSSFDELYKSIHNALSRLMDMTNFYIAMYYKELNAIQFVYARDEFDQQYEYIENFTENRSLTGDIILSKKPMFLTEDLLKALKKQERIKGTIPKIWLGVPLMIKKEVLGVMAVQSYDNPNQFTYKDLEVLSFVSGQIAVSIEKKRMETSLQQREEHFRTLFEGANDGIFILDQGRFSDCNQRTLEIFGLKSKEDLKGLMPKAISPENQPDGRVSKSAYALYIDQTLKGDPQQFYWLHNKKDGTDVHTEVSLNQFVIGKKKYIQAIVRDITERKYAEQKLAETREKLLKSEKLKAIGTLAGGIAHDFNNTLSVTLGNINLAQMVSSNAEVIQFLEDAEKSVVQAKELASKFIVFSDGGIIVKHKIEIRSFLMKTLQSISASQNLEYQLQFKDMPRHIEADPHQLKEVLKNVVVNAFEAMDGMDTVMIQCKKYKSRPDCIIISVEDKGRGIREEDIDHIFEPYYSTKPKGKDKGTGLGLSVAHSIVKNHRGNILIHTSSEKGTRIDIILPVSQTRGIKPAKAAEQVKDKKQKAPETKNSMVLLMDDDDIVLQVTSKILKRIGFEPVTATKGEEAVMIYEEHYAAGKTIDIAILDLEIKYGLGGVKTMQQLLAINPNIKGIISSGYSSDNVMKNFGEFGFTLALAKPYNLDILKEALEQLQ